jgi:hypothetical protein
MRSVVGKTIRGRVAAPHSAAIASGPPCGRCRNVIDAEAPIQDPTACEAYIDSILSIADHGKDDSRYQKLLHVAAATRWRETTADMNIT